MVEISEEEAKEIIGEGSVAAFKANATRKDEKIIGWENGEKGVKPIKELELNKKAEEQKKQDLLFSKNLFQKKLKELQNDGRINFITFHPSYSYEEFVEGITVNTDNNSEIDNEKVQYIRKWGIFKKICTKALARAINEEIDHSKPSWADQWSNIFEKYKTIQNKSEETAKQIWENTDDFVLIIDEINRGDISKIFGELITLLENDKRLGQENEIVVKLPYSNDDFGVPPNVYIIGTMNTADRSIALVDIALRRRFGFIEMAPNLDTILDGHMVKNEGELKENGVFDALQTSVEALERINKNVIKELGRDKQVGHSFFFKVKTTDDLIMVWQNEILPLIEEYFYCDYKKILRTLCLKKNNDFLNESCGIKGFENVVELNKFLSSIINGNGSLNEQ